MLIDQATGEIIEGIDEPLTFNTIEEAENALFKIADEEEHAKIRQIKIIMAIQNQKLYQQKPNEETGQPFKTMNEYWPTLIRQLQQITGGKKRSLQSWLAKYDVYCLQMDKDENWLIRLGSHAEYLLPLAARDNVTRQLKYEDEETFWGGIRYGRVRFEEAADYIANKVFESDQQPELTWDVQATKEYVAEILGKPEDDRAKEVIDAHYAGNDVKIDRLNIWIGDYKYEFNGGPIMPMDHFKTYTKNKQVEGLGEL